jgi:hypothetical protein
MSLFDAFSFREPVSTSLENALTGKRGGLRPRYFVNRAKAPFQSCGGGFF